MSLQKILEELWKIHAGLPHASFKFKLSDTLATVLSINTVLTVNKTSIYTLYIVCVCVHLQVMYIQC